ncbi:MAG TPA: alpha-amylase family glycosyl hydrolase [Flavilitoribacter sp.]|nr:alpha-amylase family glycosyl hydrolase [Flavilitoribacter sp.]
MSYHPSLYQINTRVWIRRFGPNARLKDVPDAFWDFLIDRGMDYVWLMGIWQTPDEAIPRYAFEPGLQQAYSEALPDWKPEDVIGSPYAIDRYVIHEKLGTTADLVKLRKLLNKKGLKLILDFIPNHFHSESALHKEHPDLFLHAGEEWLQADSFTFYRSPGGQITAHGKDPYFAAWLDTAQVNYFHPHAVRFMTGQLLQLTEVCDGVRCNMPMLALNEVFGRTWGHVLENATWPGAEFWGQAIKAVRDKAPAFTFIAEAYWNLESRLQHLGFDYTYDKTLTDRLKTRNVDPIRWHLMAEPDYQDRSVRFLENHDEERVAGIFSRQRAEAAAVMAATVPGMRFYFDGQWEGRRIRLPVQLGREPVEAWCGCLMARKLPLPKEPWVRSVCPCTWYFYEELCRLTKDETFRTGTWRQLSAEALTNAASLLVWEWRLGPARRLVVINYSEHLAQSVNVVLPEKDEDVTWRDTQSGQLIMDGAIGLVGPYEYRVLESVGG